MAVIWTAPRPGEEGSTGHVRATLTITNRADQILAERGLMRPEEVRTVTLDNVLVDTGATLLGLPADVIARRGLAYRQDITAQTAAGPRRTRRFRDAEITLLGCSGTFDCVELPGGRLRCWGSSRQRRSESSPTQTLGIEPDVRNGTLHLLPEGPDESHILAYRWLLQFAHRHRRRRENDAADTVQAGLRGRHGKAAAEMIRQRVLSGLISVQT